MSRWLICSSAGAASPGAHHGPRRALGAGAAHQMRPRRIPHPGRQPGSARRSASSIHRQPPDAREAQAGEAAAVDRDRAGAAAQPRERRPRRLQRQPRRDRGPDERRWDRDGNGTIGATCLRQTRAGIPPETCPGAANRKAHR